MENGVFSVLVYCGIVCIYCTKRKYTSKGVELHLEECLFKNYVSFFQFVPSVSGSLCPPKLTVLHASW